MNPSSPLPETTHRIGAVSQACGVPVSTLRVWEARYQAFQPVKTSGGHRYYRDEDVLRAQLLRRLTGQGHTISRIARLDAQQLGALLSGPAGFVAPADGGVEAPPLRIAVVGTALAARLQSAESAQHGKAAPWRLEAVFDDLASAMTADWPATPQVLVAHINSLHRSAQIELQRLIQTHGIARGVVVYGFGQSQAVEALRQAGLVVRREPVPDADLPGLIDAVRVPVPPDSSADLSPGSPIPPRRFDDATLQRVAEQASALRCECPRHVADLLRMLGSFEQYSHDCLSASPLDADLHGHLLAVTGAARVMFENALQRLAEHENFPLE
ncbi:MerR family transcriptional regulator [Amphibiibacter pelophylacis]|uniref:MerR family transcriptional regulator n=1 Tax=Amphibiibacter pelophylacis TaxID=1799477 RepID=A0ACC6P140_9BURK